MEHRQIYINYSYVFDNNGNRCDAKYFNNSLEEAEKALRSLEKCFNMLNCQDCYDSKGCKRVKNSKNAFFCSDSSFLTRCRRVVKSSYLTDCNDVTNKHNKTSLHGDIPVLLRLELSINKLLRKFNLKTLSI